MNTSDAAHDPPMDEAHDPKDVRAEVDRFLASEAFAVVGASNRPEKYGSKVFAAYLQAGREVYPVNPRETKVRGRTAYANLAALPRPIKAVSVVTPPEVTERIVEEAALAGVEAIWFQPGAESPRAVERAKALGLRVISGGPCVLVALRYREA